tara:strand:- start:1549 stop:1839 length:291 start_codon:yes stop_codon:yes gene_type:complete
MTISAKAMDAMKTLDLGDNIPSKGDRVEILRGRSKGKSGVIFWKNMTGKYYHGRRYGSATENCISDACGASCRFGVKLDDGSKVFVNWTDHVSPRS